MLPEVVFAAADAFARRLPMLPLFAISWFTLHVSIITPLR
jgi:hypothetical protein